MAMAYQRRVSMYRYTGSDVFLTPNINSCLHKISITENNIKGKVNGSTDD